MTARELLSIMLDIIAHGHGDSLLVTESEDDEFEDIGRSWRVTCNGVQLYDPRFTSTPELTDEERKQMWRDHFDIASPEIRPAVKAEHKPCADKPASFYSEIAKQCVKFIREVYHYDVFWTFVAEGVRFVVKSNRFTVECIVPFDSPKWLEKVGVYDLIMMYVINHT